MDPGRKQTRWSILGKIAPPDALRELTDDFQPRMLRWYDQMLLDAGEGLLPHLLVYGLLARGLEILLDQVLYFRVRRLVFRLCEPPNLP